MIRFWGGGVNTGLHGELKVSIAIITFRRPHELRRLLQSLAAQKSDPELRFRLRAIVIDNDPQESAREAVAAARRELELEIDYVTEPRVGIPIARNAALRQVGGDDFVGFLDDDEWAPPDWLGKMISALQRSGGDIAWGPVKSVYPAEVQSLLVRCGLFDKDKLQSHLADLERVRVAASDNVIMRWAPLAQRGLRFDEEMRFTGGSDLRFFSEAAKHGLRIHWAKHAWVHEEIPRARLNWPWLIKRQYRIGNNFFTTNIVRVPFLKRLAYVGLGMTASLSGLWIFVVGMTVVRRFVGFGRFFNGLGMIGAALGLRFEEYRPGRIIVGDERAAVRVPFDLQLPASVGS